MRRSDILLTKEAIPRQSPNEDIFPKEDSPELPVPRRKTNTLSILRKLVRECDGNEIGSSSYGPSHGSRTEEVPDHCWVGEYLDDEEQAQRSAAAMIHDTRMKDYLRRKRESYPTHATVNRSLSSSEISKQFPASSYGGNFDPGPRDEVADREMNELQRKERAKEQEILKMMLELENLRRDAKLRQSKDAAKVFDYDHGVSERSNYQDRYQPPASLKYDPFDVMSPDSSRQLNRQESAKYSSQVARDSVGDSSSAQHISELYRKVTKGDYNDYRLTVRRDGVSPQAEEVSHSIEKSHGRTNELFTNQSQSVEMLPRRRVLESPVEYDGFQLHKGRHDLSGSLASFGSAMSHRKEERKLNSSQSYEDYVNEMSRKMEMKDSDTQEEEALQIEPDMSASHLRKGLPISVLTTRQPERLDQDTRSQSSPDVVAYHEALPMKIKPTFEHFPKDSVKQDYHGSSGLAESIVDIDASTRRVPANFNDTRKVLVDDDDQGNRRRNAGSVDQSPRAVDYHSERRHVVDDRHDVGFANEARKRSYHVDRRGEKPSKPAIARKRNATEYLRGYSDSDEHGGEPFLHKNPPKHPKADKKGRHMQEDSSRSHYADTRHPETKGRDARDNEYYLNADGGYERCAREFSRNVSRSPSLEYTKSMPKPMDHIKTANISATRYSEDRESANVRRVSEICTSPSEPVMYRRGLDKSGGLDRDTAKRDEYIDQYFDRQIKIRTGAWQDDRSVERPRRKPQGAWAEEVDRYVNMLAGQERSIVSDEEGRFEDKAAKYSRGRDSSYNPKRDYRRGGKSHTRSPSPINRSVRSLSGARGSSGRDERRFERRSPGGDTREQRYSPGRFVATEIPRAVPDHRELDRRTVVQPDRKLVKRATRSPSPVPLMPPGWLALVKSRNSGADESRDQVGDIVPRKVVDRDRPLPAKRTKDFKDLRNDLKIVRTTEIIRTRAEIDEKTNQSKTQARNLKEKAKDHAPKSSATGSSKSTVHLDRNRVILNSSEVSGVRKYPAISFTVSKKGSNDKSVSSADGLSKSNAGNTPEAVSMSQTSVGMETQLKLGSPANVAASPPAVSKKGTATGNSMLGNTDDYAKKLALTSSKAKVSELQKKPTIRAKAASSKTKASDLQKNLTSKKLAHTSSKTKASDLQQNPTSKKLALASSKTKVSELQKKPTIRAKAMSSSETDVTSNATKSSKHVPSRKENVTVNKVANDASKDQSKKSGQATSASASADSVPVGQHWMQRYKTWFSTVLEPVLSKDEQVMSLGWRDPIRFLNCVTTGNKRAMSHIPRGEHAIEMLRFIALNKNESDPEGSSEDNARSATVVKKQASAAETQQKNKGKDTRVNEGPVKNVVPKVPKDEPVSLHAKRDLTASKDKFGNAINNQKEKAPDSYSGSVDKDDSIAVSISRPKSNRDTSNTPEMVRKEDRDVTTQKEDVTPRKDKCLPEQDPTNVSDSKKKQPECTMKQPHVAKKKPNSAAKSKQPQRPQSQSPADAIVTSNAVNKYQTKQRSRSTQENESKRLDSKPKSQSTERRKSVTAPSRSTVEPKHAKNAPGKSRQHTSKSKDRKPDVKWPGDRKSRSDSNQNDRSDEKIIIPSEEPILSAAQKGVLPAFKKRVERTTVRQLNVLYSIDKYDKANVISAAKDSLSAFKLSNGGSQGFSTKHALYYMSALFKDPPSDSADDVNRQYRKYDLDGPKFELSLRNFHLFQNVVLTLCKDRLDPNRIAMSQDQIKRSFVRQQAEFLFPQFCNEADALIKLWCWHERMKIVLDNESLARMHSKLQPFPDNHGQSLENTIAQWTKSVVVGPLYNQIDSFSYSVVCAIKTELMKRRPHVSRQEAMKILLQSWIRNHFEDIERRRKPAKETVIEPVEDSPESELMVLDEVYSDESEDENEFDITDDSESVQIDLF